MVAQIMAREEIKFLGGFEDEIKAGKAYDEAAKKYHGEFANLNFPGTDYRSAASSFNKKKPIRLPAM